MNYGSLVAQLEAAYVESPRNETKIQNLVSEVYAIELSHYSGVKC